jgi:LCP family protein required for cell wall assembly
MVSKQWLRAGGLAALAAVATLAGFFIFRQSVSQQISQQIAQQSARSAFGQKQLNILVLGYQDDENTTDTIILAHVDVDRRTATLVSIPRDTWVPVPGDGHDKINAAYAFGGAKTSTKVVSALFGGVPIDATVAIQPEGAAQIVDAMGGLNINVDEDMDYDDNYGQLHIHLKKGEQYLTGSKVVGYMRFRHDAASDFGRVHRQQQVLKAMMVQLSEPQNWAKLPRLLEFARKDVKTSLGDQQLVALLEIYRNVPDENIRTFTLPSKAGWVGEASVVFADKRWASLIGTLLFSKVQPPSDEVVVANATGNTEFDKTLIGALRGAGWNVPTFVDQPRRAMSSVSGETLAARSLSKTFALSLKAAKDTTLVIGTDLAPDEE